MINLKKQCNKDETIPEKISNLEPEECYPM
jgi:hypothetical protein